MSIWNSISDAASDVVSGAEYVAAGAAHAFIDEVNDIYDAAKTVVHQAELLGKGVVTGVILNPINGIGQIVNNVAGTELPKLEFENQAEVNDSIAGKVGIVAGTIGTFVLTSGATSALIGIEAGGVASLAIAGAVQGGIFTPSDQSKTGGAFFLDRAENAAIEAVSLAVMGGVAGRLGQLYDPAAGLGLRMVQSATINGIGGGVGGLVTSEATAVLKEGRLATAGEVTLSVAHGTIFGAGVGAGTVALEAAVQAARGPLKPGDDVRPRLNRGYENPDQVAGQIDVRGEVSPRFINEVAGTMDKFPDKVRRFMVDDDIRVRVAKQVTDIDPTLKGQHPNGWKGGTWENAEGYYFPRDGAVVSEYKLDANNNLVRSNRIPGVARHEIGHGIDNKLAKWTPTHDLLTETPEFLKAWNADVAKLTAAEKVRLDYYIQPTNPLKGRGPSEAFADLFAAIHGGSSIPQETQYIMQKFPLTTWLIKQIIPKLP